MALCPLAIASTADQTNGTGSYYFALSGSGGGGGPLIDQSFLATGTAVPFTPGLFTSQTTAGYNAFKIEDLSGVARWGLGLANAETGANVGSDLNFNAYDDAGVLLTIPMTINRASGQVIVNTGLTVNGNAVITGSSLSFSGATVDMSGATVTVDNIVSNLTAAVGVPTSIGGGLLEIDGTLGLSRVYDGVYNQPQTGGGGLLFTASVDGVTGGLPQPPFTAPITGTYILSLTLQATVPLFSWTPGTSALLYGLTYNGGVNIVSGGQLYCPLITNPTGMGALTPGLGPGIVEYQNDILVELVAGTAYTINPLSTGTVNLGTGGNVAVSVVQLFA